MEKFDLRKENADDWLQQIASGKTYVTPSFEQDDYGTFLTARAPIYDSQGRYSGFVGVDFDTQYYAMREARFRAIAIASLGSALLPALVIGYGVALYHGTMQRRIQELHDSSIHDSLTGLFNRQGVMEVIKKALESHVGKSAVILVDVDDLTMINDLHGHVAGDAVIARTSEAIRESMRLTKPRTSQGGFFLPCPSRGCRWRACHSACRSASRYAIPTRQTSPECIGRPMLHCIRHGRRAGTASLSRRPPWHASPNAR
jgi:Diguanylate cyclase, GGDEF domain